MACYSYQGLVPVVDPKSYVHPLASLIGDVHVGPGCFIGPGASLRGDYGRIVVEGDTSVQDSATVHANALRDTLIRRGATIAHGAVIHGCEVGENTLVGINAVVLDNTVIGAECLIAAMSLVRSDLNIPDRSLLAGNPAKILRQFAPEQVTWKNDGEGQYQRLARAALKDFFPVEPLAEAEPDRKRLATDAIAVRLKGPQAEERERRARHGQQ